MIKVKAYPTPKYTQEELQERVEISLEGDQFDVLRLLLVVHAPSFASSFKFKGVKLVYLDDVSTDTFNIFLSWLRMEYERNRGNRNNVWDDLVASYHPTWITDEIDGMDHYRTDCDPLNFADYYFLSIGQDVVDIFIFAEAYDIPRLRLDAIDRLVWCHNRKYEGEGYFSAATIEKAYKHTKCGSPLRMILAKGYSAFGDKGVPAMMALPKEFLVDVLATQAVDGSASELDPCTFHAHESVKEREDCVVRVDMKSLE